MSGKIKYSYAVEIEGNTIVSTNDTIEVDGYSKNEIEVESSDDKVVLEDAFPIQENNGLKNIKFLLIRETEDVYDGNLEYAFSEDGGSLEFWSLDHPIILPVGGAIKGIDKEDLTLKLENTDNETENRTVQVVVGRLTS